MSQYSKISQDLEGQRSRNEMLHRQIEERLDQVLDEFWRMKTMLKFVDTLELTMDSMTAWIQSHLAEE